jgi:hypothetical protein
MSEKTGISIRGVGEYLFLVLCFVMVLLYARIKWDTTVSFVVEWLGKGMQ